MIPYFTLFRSMYRSGFLVSFILLTCSYRDLNCIINGLTQKTENAEKLTKENLPISSYLPIPFFPSVFSVSSVANS